MLRIRVSAPTKTPSRYAFQFSVKRERSAGDAQLGADSLLAESQERFAEGTYHFGFESANFEIKHSDLWDSIFPLFFLTRNGGPLYNKADSQAIVEFDYPILEPVASFYTKRAANFGLDVTVNAETFTRTYDLPTSGHSLSFGGGKESRLLLGVLRETGAAPAVYTSGAAYAVDLPEAHITESVSGTHAERVMPTLMSLPRILIHGSVLGAVSHETPWQQTYDFGSRYALDEMAMMLRYFGINMDLIAPASVLPAALVQRILHDRYGDLYRHQQSARTGGCHRLR